MYSPRNQAPSQSLSFRLVSHLWNSFVISDFIFNVASPECGWFDPFTKENIDTSFVFNEQKARNNQRMITGGESKKKLFHRLNFVAQSLLQYACVLGDFPRQSLEKPYLTLSSLRSLGIAPVEAVGLCSLGLCV